MKCIRTIKEEIFPTVEQKQKILQTIGCCRFVYNYMLSRNRKAYERRKEPVMNAFAMCNLLPHLKQVYPWLREADSRALQQSCRRLSVAYNKFFKEKKGYPKFKSRKCLLQSYTVTGLKMSRIMDSFVKLPSLGKVRWNPTRKVGSVHTSATILVKNDRYFVCLITETENYTVPVIVSDNDKVIGLDYKSDGLYIDSNAYCANMPHYYRKVQRRLKWLQQKLSRRIESHIVGYGEKHCPVYDRKLSDCKNVQKQRKKVAKLYEHIANQRKDFLHKQSTAIAKQYDVVCVEDLNMKALANRGFHNGKATLDNGYGKFLVLLRYKLEERGKHFVKVDKFFSSSQICSDCGYQNDAVKDLRIRYWKCPCCGEEHDRDLNAAVNIRNEGLRLLLQQKVV